MMRRPRSRMKLKASGPNTPGVSTAMGTNGDWAPDGCSWLF